MVKLVAQHTGGVRTFIVGNCDLVFLSSALIASCHVEYRVCIDIESNINLWHATGCRGNTRKFEFTQQVVVFGHYTFALEHLIEDKNKF